MVVGSGTRRGRHSEAIAETLILVVVHTSTCRDFTDRQ